MHMKLDFKKQNSSSSAKSYVDFCGQTHTHTHTQHVSVFVENIQDLHHIKGLLLPQHEDLLMICSSSPVIYNYNRLIIVA